MLKHTHEIERSNLNCFGMLCSLDASESNSWEGGKRARGRGGGRAAEERGFSTQKSVLIVGGYTGGWGWRGLSGELMRCTAAEGDIERLSC